ncbi:AMP-binding protein [Streptomyces sp. NBRC 109706]|uniref:AMP-binding protein n=1 Tax=Streptomyces sp. NBRC 109706 TaxID=1550035 RepID=UPI00131CC4C3|nr:AMP-binding protein [Streptomyces sp. NBRC 109706]
MTPRPRPATLTELLEARRGAPGRYVAYSPSGARSLSFAEVAEESAALASGLRAVAPPPGSPDDIGNVVIALADPFAFITTFFAIAAAGGVAVPAPVRALVHPGHRSRILNIVKASRPSLVVTDEPQVKGLTDALDGSDIPVISLDELPRHGSGAPGELARTSPTAYVQYTSGSMADPKPIALRHDHVLAQLRQAAHAFGETADSVSVNWVPLYHDMGLVTSVLRPLWSGYSSVILDPFDFVRNPSLWPEAMSAWHATHTSAPDFGYALCAQRTADPGRYDLGSLRVARTAGEVVRPETLSLFSDAFGPAGFRRSAFKPSYGLAEATLTVTTCPLDEAPTVLTVSRSGLRAGSVDRPNDAGDTMELVACGPPVRDTSVWIAAPDGTPLEGEGRIGEVWISGPQVAEADDAGAGGDHLSGARGRGTGDIGFLSGGQLALLGRSRERFQVRGENYYSGEIEAAVSQSDERLRLGRTAVFLSHGTEPGGSLLVVLAELRQGHENVDAAGRAELTRKITRLLSSVHSLSPGRILLLPAGTLPVTTSGKLQREACRTWFEDQGSGPLPAPSEHDERLKGS